MENVFDQSGHLFTNNLSNQIAETTIDSKIQAVEKITFRFLFF